MKHFGHEVFPTALILIDSLMQLSLVLEHFNIISLYIQGYLSSLSMKAFCYINLDGAVTGINCH